MSLRMWRKNGPVLDIKEKRGFFDVAYGSESELQKMDVWLPEGNGPFPAVISIHGGGFVACDKRQKDMVAPMLFGLSKGYAIISVNYRLAPAAKFPDPVMDIKQAIRFIRVHAGEWKVDESKLAVWGGSAGGYMTLMSCLCADKGYFDNPKDENCDRSAAVTAGVAWYPQSDFLSCDEELEINSIINRSMEVENVDLSEEYEPAFPPSKESDFPFHHREESVCTLFLGSQVSENREAAKMASPIFYIHKKMPPMLVQHGTKDEILPMQQSIRFAMEANKQCGEERVRLELIPGAIHSSVLFETEENLEHIF